MADKRISQLVDRGTVANNDVVPIVVSGASTTNKATISSIQTFMQGNLDMGVTSVGLSMPSAFLVSNSPVTASGNISVAGAGTVSQYIRGDGSLADFPSGGGGGGSSVNYYLNGSVSQGTIGGITYQEMNRTPILGAGTDFTIAADGYIASFITDAGDPALLEIPAGNWNFETYLQASSGGGTPSFYIELYKVNSGGTATLIASNSGSPELIAFGTTTTPYFSALAVPTTSLTLTDRLALRYYVTHSGRTITLHTENATLCQIVTTFTTGLTALNGLTAQVQNFATGTSGTDFGISSSVNTHTFNLPDASASARGVVTTGSQTFAGAKTFNSSVTASSLIRTGGTSSQFLKADGSVDSSTYLTTGSAGSTYVPYSGAAANVDLGVYNLTASAIIANGSGSNSGIIHLESNAFHSLVNGYGSISSGTTNQFNLYQTTGAGVFRCAILSLNSITASATRTYTLPDADGTLALTSSLGAYLPLAGGTLTGALNGTSASFSGNVEIGNTVGGSINSASGLGNLVVGNGGASSQGITIYTASSTYGGLNFADATSGGGAYAGYIKFDHSNDSMGFFIGNTPRLTISSTGAATFSSSVTATSFNLGNGQFLRLTRTSGGLQYDALGIVAGTDNTRLISTGDFDIVNGALTSYFKVSSTGAATFSSSATVSANFQSSGTTPYWVFQSTGAGGTGYLGFGASLISGSAATDFILRSDNVLKFAVGNNNSMVINATGNVGIGTSSPTNKLVVDGYGTANSIMTQPVATFAGSNGWNLGSDGTNALIGVTNSGTDMVFLKRVAGVYSDAMRITSLGYTKARGSESSYYGATLPFHELRTGQGDEWIAICSNTSASPYGLRIIYPSSAPNNSDNWPLYFNDLNAFRFGVQSNGNVLNQNGSYGSISDIKLKENIEDATPKLDDLMKVKVRNYNLIGDDKKQIGVIAQELEEVFPAMIDESEDFEELEVPQVDEEGNEILNEEGEVVTTKERVSKGTSTKSVKYSVFVPMLIKAIQELKIEIDSLKNQIQ